MGRPRVFTRVVELPDGSLQRTNSQSEGRIIHGLSLTESNRQYYSLDDRTRKRASHRAGSKVKASAKKLFDCLDCWADWIGAKKQTQESTQRFLRRFTNAVDMGHPASLRRLGVLGG